jgi:hypothetical protein
MRMAHELMAAAVRCSACRLVEVQRNPTVEHATIAQGADQSSAYCVNNLASP